MDDWYKIKCTKCGEFKPESEFYHRPITCYVSSHCKSCIGEWQKEYHKQRWVYDAKAKQSNARNRGIVCDDIDAWYNTQYDIQQGKCAMTDCAYIAPKDARNHSRLHIDHDHITGKPRGLLCGNCNRLIGFYEKALQRPAVEIYLRTIIPVP